MPKAVIVAPGGGFSAVSIIDRPERKPEPGEIKVRLRASSLNFHDYAVVSGLAGPAEARIPMADGAGEVIEAGPGVRDFAVGDNVVSTFFTDWPDGTPVAAGFGSVPGDGLDGYAREVVTAAASSFTRAPRDWSHEEAATLPTAALAAWRALFADGGVRPGSTVLVQGTGGVSIFALQFAKLAGATVIATSSSDEKLERLRGLGADHLVNYRVRPDWDEAALAITGGRGVDHILDIGGEATLPRSMNAIRVAGQISVIGVLSGVTAPVSIVSALSKQIRLQGVLVGCRAQQIAMIGAIEAAGLRPVIDRTFPLDQIVEAFRYQETNRHFGKICLSF